jgi:hypothetical protein
MLAEERERNMRGGGRMEEADEQERDVKGGWGGKGKGGMGGEGEGGGGPRHIIHTGDKSNTMRHMSIN